MEDGWRPIGRCESKLCSEWIKCNQRRLYFTFHHHYYTDEPRPSIPSPPYHPKSQVDMQNNIMPVIENKIHFISKHWTRFRKGYILQFQSFFFECISLLGPRSPMGLELSPTRLKYSAAQVSACWTARLNSACSSGGRRCKILPV